MIRTLFYFYHCYYSAETLAYFTCTLAGAYTLSRLLPLTPLAYVHILGKIRTCQQLSLEFTRTGLHILLLTRITPK